VTPYAGFARDQEQEQYSLFRVNFPIRNVWPLDLSAGIPSKLYQMKQKVRILKSKENTFTKKRVEIFFSIPAFSH
jgi:hypothetical protein